MLSLTSMTILILAGGISKRMWPLTTDKLLIPLLGKPFFYHTLKSLKDAKPDLKVAIVANPRNRAGLEKITKELGIDAKFAVQQEAKGMADAILTAESLLDESVLIMNGDDLLDPKIYAQVLSQINSNSGGIQTVGKVVKDYFPGGYLVLKDGQVTGVIERPGRGSEPSDMVKLVFDYFKDSRTLISTLKEATSDKDEIYEVALDNLIKKGLKVSVTRYEGEWGALKYPWHILHLVSILLGRIEKNISPNAVVATSAVINGPVVIEEGVKIFEGATINGPCYIGKNCVIGNNSLVRESVLEEGVVAGFGSEIARSYIGEGSWFHTNYVGDSVIEGNFGMGSGAVTANLRLDGKTIRTFDNTIDTGLEKLGVIAGTGVRVGINAMIMPGINLGAVSLIGPGVLISKNVSENKRVLLKQEHTETENKDVNTFDKFRENLNK
ncbi:MAG TPA: sugar phosphate nucleotidyltransferase [Candidatus Nanoarchaeia archaeon]|nr:bifunctional protein GlmU [uncultured archaeon]